MIIDHMIDHLIDHMIDGNFFSLISEKLGRINYVNVFNVKEIFRVPVVSSFDIWYSIIFNEDVTAEMIYRVNKRCIFIVKEISESLRAIHNCLSSDSKVVTHGD